MDQSYFVDWQKGKVQENPDEVGGRVLGVCWVAAGGAGMCRHVHTCAGIGLWMDIVVLQCPACHLPCHSLSPALTLSF